MTVIVCRGTGLWGRRMVNERDLVLIIPKPKWPSHETRTGIRGTTPPRNADTFRKTCKNSKVGKKI